MSLINETYDYQKRYYQNLSNPNEKLVQEQKETAHKLELIKDAGQKRRKKFQEAKAALKESLLFEALNHVCEGALKVSTDQNRTLMRNLVADYIKENEVDSLLRRMSTKTVFLSELAYMVNSVYEDAVEDMSEECPDPDKEKIEDFMDRLDKLQSAEDVENAIRIKVANAEEEFITDNMEDKYHSNTILNMVNDRIAALKQDKYADNEDYQDAVEQEATRMLNRNIERYVTNRNKTVFETMVLKLAETAMTTDGAVKEQLTESGDLDVDSVVETTRVIFTFMESLRTMKLEKMEEAYLEKFLKEF